MNFKILALMLLPIFLLASLVSSEGVSTAYVSGNSPAVNPGETFEVKFKLNNSETTKNVTNIAVSYSDSQNAPLLQLTSVKLGSTAYSISAQVDPLNEDILIYTSALTNAKVLNGSVSDFITLTFKVSGQAPASIGNSKTIAIKAKYEDGVNAAIASIPLTFTVNSNPSLTITKIKDLNRNSNGTISIKNTGNTRITNIALSNAGDFSVSFSQTSEFPLNAGESKIVEVNANDLNSLKFGENSVTITATSTSVVNNASAQYTFVIQKSFCSRGAVGTNLSLTNGDPRSDGDDDTIWKPLDTIKVKVEVENLATVSIGSIYAELGLFDSNGKNVAKDLTFISRDDESVKIGSIKDGDRKSFLFEFKVPADIKEGNYKLAVKTYSKESGLGEDKLCTDKSSDLGNLIYQNVRIEKQDNDGKFITFDKVTTSPSELVCGDKAVLNFDILNIGTEDQDRVKAILYNKELGINIFEEIKSGLDMGDSKSMSFSFDVPASVSNKTYKLILTSEYDYSDGTYGKSSSDSFEVPLKVICLSSASSINGKTALITASLGSEAVAGKSMVISSKISNTGATSASFIVGAKSYESWASLDSISERVFTLAPGESKNVLITLNVNADANGEKSFVIETIANGKSETREVAVNIAGTNASSISSYFKNNYLIWIIGAVNLLLIILIIFVAVRVSRR